MISVPILSPHHHRIWSIRPLLLAPASTNVAEYSSEDEHKRVFWWCLDFADKEKYVFVYPEDFLSWKKNINTVCVQNITNFKCSSCLIYFWLQFWAFQLRVESRLLYGHSFLLPPFRKKSRIAVNHYLLKPGWVLGFTV